MLENFLIGTYTRKSSQGIYTIELDTNTNQLSEASLLVNAQNPTYLGISAANNLYSVVKDGSQGGIGAYNLDTTPVTMLNSVLGAGSPPAYVAIDEQRQLVFSGNYHQGTITVFKINDDGSITQTDQVTHQGLTGPAKEQDAPHVHYCDLTPDNRLVVCDLGMDLVAVYDISADGKLTAVSQYHNEPGFGSRHIKFNPVNPNTAYVLGELSSKLEVLKYNQSLGEFTHQQTISTIPTDWTAHNGAAAIHISADGKYIYTSNRGQDTIAVFKVLSDQSVELIQSISTEGSFPRDFSFDRLEKFIVCANQETDNLTLFERNSVTGRLTLLQKDVRCPEGVCVKIKP
ncbi:lactonase family protein [Paucilactobacillus kaifaensis]|uniref:lactonase family protein n=1 Tax=Paucilactobacillus kaifaensis TaxID=2559921 RepID=UPI0010F96A0D|nr:lactonase family protein [Paucilactobacillus kaifaensis]